MNDHKPLDVTDLYHLCDPGLLEFETTDELEPLEQLPGQERALEAINFSVDIDQSGFNLYVLGPAGLGKHRLVKDILQQRAADAEPPSDWCYVNNFSNPQKPLVLKLQAGMGEQLRKDMEQLVEDLLTGLPAAFESEEYRNRLQEIQDVFKKNQQQAFEKLDKEALERGIAVLRTPGGYTLAPLVGNKVIGPEEYKKLSHEEQQRYERIIEELQQSLRNLIQDIPLRQREHHQQIKALKKEISRMTLERLVDWLEQRYTGEPQIEAYINAVKEDVIDNVQNFLPAEESVAPDNVKNLVMEFRQYSVNVLVDNSGSAAAPVVYEDNPTYQNLVGRVEHVAQMGTLLTNFTLIKPGALHRANGGYLILDARKVLTHAFAWEGLKRALSSAEIKVESLQQMLSLVSTLSLEPEPMPLDIKVVLTGEPLLYYLLKEYDPEFSMLFKVSADLSDDTLRSTESTMLYARLIAMLQQRARVRPLHRAAVARVIEEASRMADDAEKLSLRVETLSDLLQEASYLAGKEGREVVNLADVESAIAKRRYRQERIHDRMLEQIARGIHLIDTGGEKIAQVNALAVIQLGDYAFGRPSRITATARLGKGDVVDIEREAKLGGDIHSKAVLILSSYLADRYAHDAPLALSASLVFEQSYGIIEGDSASAAELCVLLSAIGRIPLKQSLAVTGSINQLGEIQAVGGVNEKVEGFFDVCQQRGLSGDQGVIIPAANRVHLMLRQDVRDAVEAGNFHLFTSSHVEDVMELLSGLPRGVAGSDNAYPPDSCNGMVQRRIEQLQQLQRRYAHADKEHTGESQDDSGDD
jgi:lon-related putative ATP-dependent protease